MLLFLAEGRLGNQIFQYVFLRTIQKNKEKIITSGFEELIEVFDVNDVINLDKKNRAVRIFLFRFCNPVLHFLGNKKIITKIVVNREGIMNSYTRETSSFQKTKGLFKGIIFIELGFFQSESFFSERIAKKLQIKKTYLDKANGKLKKIARSRYKVFVHIRRGDYDKYTVYGESSLLPLKYYKKQIEWFLVNKSNCWFIFLSDEPEFIKDKFKNVKNKYIFSSNHYGTDLAIMTRCEGAILSPSSFGWWGGYLMKDRDIVFAPKYWLGFNSRIEYQKKGTPYYATKISV